MRDNYPDLIDWQTGRLLQNSSVILLHKHCRCEPVIEGCDEAYFSYGHLKYAEQVVQPTFSLLNIK